MAFNGWPERALDFYDGLAAAKDRLVSFFRTSQPLCTWLTDHVGR